MVRICVIGAGPSGMSVLDHVCRINDEDPKAKVDVICYEKQSNWGGLWNYTWRTGLDEHGEYVHNSMYRFLWSNGPKEASLEFPDYTFEEHFGKLIGSFPPREVIYDYITTRWEKKGLRKFICFQHVVRSVNFDSRSNKFIVAVKSLSSDVVMPPQAFDYVINCTGHFSVPNMPSFDGFDSFPGHILHAHDFRNAEEFCGQRLLIIGASYSAEDIGLQCLKYGAKHVICSYRTRPMEFNWPEGVEERPLLLRIEGKVAFFKDGTTAEVDSIILCTGYLHHYPYLSEELRLRGFNEMYNAKLYKGTVWMPAGNGRMMYVGAQDQYYTFTMLDAQARWAVKYAAGHIKMPRREEAIRNMNMWRQRALTLQDCHEDIDFQTDFVMDFVKEADYGADLDIGHLFHAWEEHKHQDIMTYRDKSHTSKFTGKATPLHHTKWWDAKDDSKATYLEDKK